MKKLWKYRTAAGLLLIVLAAVLLAGCGMSTEDLTEQVRASIEETWAEQGIEAEIKDFSLIKKSKTDYRGILKASADGETVQFTINVTVDGESFMWEIEE
jgi:hypothetical protein